MGDQFENMMQADLPLLLKLQYLIESIAASFDLPACIVAGIISRESGGGRLLGQHGCPPLTGDGGHGRGLMQIDDRWHLDYLRCGGTTFWKSDAGNIAFGCHQLRQNIEWVKTNLPGLDDHARMRAAIAGYNCGLGTVSKNVKAGADIDAGTAGHDYSRDVLVRADWLAAKGFTG